MPGIDQLLSLVKSQGANELRLAVGQEPQMFASGRRLRLTMAETSDFALRHLISELLTPERLTRLHDDMHLTLEHVVPNVGEFRVSLTEQGPETLKVNFQLTPQTARSATEIAHKPTSREPVALERRLQASLESSPRAPDDEPSPSVSVDDNDLLITEPLRALVRLAHERRASDIHLAEGTEGCLRIDGRLVRVELPHAASFQELLPVPERQRASLLAGNAVEFGLDLPKVGRLRISLYRCETGTAAAIRLLPREPPSLGELAFPVPIDDLVDLTHGLVLVCGATGSGKSTTLAALAGEAIRRRSILLTTLEDPIEYNLAVPEQSIVRRRQLGRDFVSFRSGLREALRADPDVILVGELRDPETIQLTLTAAETGHLVLASIHSGGAAAAIERIVDAYSSDRRSQVRIQLADGLRAIIAQQLLPCANGKGRVAAVEILRVTHAVSNVIREGRTAQIGTLLQSGKREGMLSMDRCLADYVQRKVVTLEQAKARAFEPDSLAMYLAK